MALAPADDNAVFGVDGAGILVELDDGRAAGSEAEELGGDLGVFPLIFVHADGLPVAFR